MQEYRCNQCGYSKWQQESYDLMLEMPTFGSFYVGNMLPMMNYAGTGQGSACPNCGKLSGWGPIINNATFQHK